MTAPSALRADEASLGLRRVVVPTAAGAVTVRTGRETGGPALVLLHGAAGSWTTWTPLLAAAERCGMPLTDVVAIDLPGWGDSPGPVPTPGSMAAIVADVARALGYAQWHLLGHSLGGAVALDVAARFGAETLSVALVSPSGAGVRDAVRHPVRGGLRLPGFAGMLLAMRMLAAFGSGSLTLLRTLRATGVLRLLTRPLFRYPAGVDRSVTDALADEVRPASFVAAAAAASPPSRSTSSPARATSPTSSSPSRPSSPSPPAGSLPPHSPPPHPNSGSTQQHPIRCRTRTQAERRPLARFARCAWMTPGSRSIQPEFGPVPPRIAHSPA